MMMCLPYPRDQGLFPDSRPSPCPTERGPPRPETPRSITTSPIHRTSIHPGLDDLGERVPRAIEPRLHRAEVAVRDLGDLLVGLPFELPQDEHFAMVRWQLRDRLRHQLAQVTLAVEIVRTCRRIFELEWAIFVLPASLHRLEEHERVPRAVPELVLRQVRCNRVRPRRELLRSIEAVQVPVDPDEHLLHQVLRLFAVADL